MTSREFYLCIDAALAPICERIGFARVQSITSTWTLDLTIGRLFYEVKKDSRHHYDALTGGQFHVQCHVGSQQAGQNPSTDEIVSYMQYFTDDDLAGLRQLRDRVIEKVLARQPADEFERLTMEAAAPILRLSLGSEFRRHQVIGLPYLDAGDVTAWGDFLAARLERFVDGVKSDESLSSGR